VVTSIAFLKTVPYFRGAVSKGNRSRGRLRGILGAVLVRFFLYAGNKITAALAQETAYGTYFLWLPVFVGSGAVGYFHLEFEPSLNKLLALTLLLALFAGLTRPLRIVTLILMAVLAASLGAVLAKLETLRLDTH